MIYLKQTYWGLGFAALAVFLILLLVLVITPQFANAAPPNTMNFQGRLRDNSGNIKPDGLYNMQFKIFTVSSGGTAVWTETRETTNRVQVTNGLFSVQLGSVTPLNPATFDSANLYFEITMATPATATCSTAACASWETPMSPRNKLATSAYAFNAANAENAKNSDTLDGLDSTAFAAASGSTNYIQNQSASPQTASFNISGTGTAATIRTANLDTATASTLTIGGTNATSVTVAKDMMIAAGKTISMVGGVTSLRPASPSEGTIYFDSQSKELLVYADTSWQPLNSSSVGDNMAATTTVAASNSSQAAKDAADYVVDGTSDQVEINSALVNSPGGRVYLFEGTYTISNRISIPTNTTLVGSGYGTLIQFANFGSTSTNVVAISNTDVSGYSGVGVRDLRLDGRKSVNTAGTQHGIDFSGMGQTSGKGALIDNVYISNFRNRGIALYGGSSNTISNSFFSGNGTGVYFESLNNTISSNTFIDNTLGIDTYASYQNIFSDNTIRGGARGINLSSSSGNMINSNNIIDASGSGIYLAGSSFNTLEANKITNSGGSTANNGIYLDSSSNNLVSSNAISDSSATSTNYALNIFNSGSVSNTFSNNQLASGSLIYNLGSGTIFSSQLDGSGKLLNRSSGGFAVQNTSGTDVLNVNATTGLLTVSDDALVKTSSQTALLVQSTNDEAVFTVDTAVKRVIIGSPTDGISLSKYGILLRGTARHIKTMTLQPEYSGATFRGDASNNNGSLSSDFCSGSAAMNVNAAACPSPSSYTTNYYQWTTDQATAQEYDIYVPFRAPDDISGALTGFSVAGFASTSGDSVEVTTYYDGTPCGASVDITTAGQWAASSLLSQISGCEFAGGDTVWIKITLTATQDNFARVGNIDFSYLSGRP